MKISELAYVAGILDGEGHITIARGPDPKSHIGYRHRLLVGITNTNKDLIAWLQVKFGGSYYHIKARSEKHKDSFIWRLHSAKASDFLKLVLPYLKLKRLQAETAVEFQANIQSSRTERLTDGELAVREAQHILVTNLNRKGP